MESPVLAPKPFRNTTRVAALIGLSALSFTQELNPIYLALSWAGLLVSLFLDMRPSLQASMRRLETGAVLVLVGLTLLDFFHWGSTLFVAVAHFLLLFQLIKLAGLKETKDCMQIFVVSFFQMLSACTLSVDAWQGVMLLFFVPTGIAGLFWHEVSRHEEKRGRTFLLPAQKPYRTLLILICVVALPLVGVLAGSMFLVFPRLGFRSALGGLGFGKSGYTEQVNLGAGGSISESASPVLWLKIPERERSRWKGYLRGTTLDRFDGKSWTSSGTGIQETLFLDASGSFRVAHVPRELLRDALHQEVTLVNTSGATLFGSPMVAEVMAPFSTLQSRTDGSLRWTTGWRKPLNYRVISFDVPLAMQGHRRRVERELERNLVLPQVSYDSIRKLVQDISRSQEPREQANELLAYLQENYTYTLRSVASSGSDPVHDFLFVQKSGSCGHFASAMAVMLRLQGIPARVVAGYYKGKWNSRAEQYLIREKDAHAWVEAYFPEEGWVMLDPSPRVEAAASSSRMLIRLQENWDYANFHWDRLVIQYDLYSQIKMAEGIQERSSRMEFGAEKNVERNDQALAGKVAMGGFVTLLLGMGGIIIGWRLHRRKDAVDPAIVFYQRFLVRMEKKGFPKKRWETGMEFANRLPKSERDPNPKEVTERYYKVRFAD
jgi:protein-glutamine gamma-glutamyltransferase